MLLSAIIVSVGAAAAQASLREGPAPLTVSGSIDPVTSASELPSRPSGERWRLELEAGAVWSHRNDIRSPGDTGTRFSLTDVTGEGPWPVGRVTLEYDLNERHGLRFLYAPVRTDGFGNLRKAVVFEDQSFVPGRARARYQFDTYRLAYRYTFTDTQRWTWKGGATVLVRDASIEVSQGGSTGRKTDLGVVPLLNLTGEWSFAEGWVGIFDFEGSAAPQGRAFDVALKVGYELRPGVRLSVGYRTIEGGADNDEVFTFTWVNAAVASLRWSF
jgi:hypothetical protein